MNRIHWWTLLGVSGTGLAALWLGQSVLGQPGMTETQPLPTPPIHVVQAAPAASGGQLPQFEPLPSGPSFPSSSPGTNPPRTLDLQPVAVQSSPAPGLLKTEAGNPLLLNANMQKQSASTVALDVQPGRQQPAISIEWGGPTSVRISQPMSCQIVVRNTSTTPVHNLVVRHKLGKGITCKATEPQAVREEGALVWNVGTLAPEQSRRIDLVLISQLRGALNNQATVTFSAVAAHHVQVREPQLLVKMSGPAKVIVGENVILLFALSNPGDGVAEAVKLKLTLPDGLDHPRGKLIEFDVGNIAPGEIRPMQLVCQAKGSGVQKCSIVASGEGGLSANHAAQLEILMPKLDVAMSGPKLRYLDRHAVYLLKVANPGSAPANGVEVQELIPTGFKFHQANFGGQYQEATRLVTWNLGDLQPGQTRDIAVDLIPVEPGEHRLIAHAKAARGLKSQADARTMVEGLPSLSIEVGHVDDPLEVGAETAYEIRLANTGTKTETNVEVVCTLPDQLKLLGAKCSTTLRYRQDGRELIFEPLARLAPKADVIYRVQVRGLAPGDIRFRTRIKSDGLREPVLREESTRIYSDDSPVRSTTSTPLASPPIVPAITPLVPTSTPPGPLPAPSVNVPSPIPMPMPIIPLPSTPSPSVPLPILPPLPSVLPSPLPASPINPQGSLRSRRNDKPEALARTCVVLARV
jgi:hypothetical protein